MKISVPHLFRQARRLYRKRGKWRYDSTGHCATCGEAAFFVDDREMREWMGTLTAQWDQSERCKASLIERENWFCLNCFANFRIRACAKTILRLVGLPHVDALFRRLRKDRSFRFYETAAYNVFRTRMLREAPGYVVSEYFNDIPPGASSDNGIRSENLECLTFPSSHFDVVVNSDVLEHVHDLPRALAEIHRVLKPGGYHVFTVPVDEELPGTRDRVRFSGGNPYQLLPPVFHGDTIREEGALVIRDFGRDILEYLGNDQMPCREERSGRHGAHLTSVFFARKMR